MIIASPYVISYILEGVLFWILARKESQKPYLQALFVWLLSQLIQHTLELILILEITLDTMAMLAMLSLLPTLIGTSLGIDSKARSKHANKD